MADNNNVRSKSKASRSLVRSRSGKDDKIARSSSYEDSDWQLGLAESSRAPKPKVKKGTRRTSPPPARSTYHFDFDDFASARPSGSRKHSSRLRSLSRASGRHTAHSSRPSRQSGDRSSRSKSSHGHRTHRQSVTVSLDRQSIRPTAHDNDIDHIHDIPTEHRALSGHIRQDDDRQEVSDSDSENYKPALDSSNPKSSVLFTKNICINNYGNIYFIATKKFNELDFNEQSASESDNENTGSNLSESINDESCTEPTCLLERNRRLPLNIPETSSSSFYRSIDRSNNSSQSLTDTTLLSEHTIIDLSTGVVTFYMDTLTPRTPAIAVASGPYIYVYKNLHPYFKFTLPPLDIHPVEEDLWNQAKNDQVNILNMRDTLEAMRQEGASLTVRSIKLLQMETNNLQNFVNLHKNTPLKKQTVITCLSTMKKSLLDDDAISCLVLGTENKSIYILDPVAFTVLATVNLPNVPVFISVNGLFDVDYRIVVSCRNGCIYTLKRGSTDVTRNMIELNSQPFGMERGNKNIYVGCMDETLHCFTSKGKKLWTVRLPASITAMEAIDYKPKSFTAVIVALNNQEVHIYKEKYLVDVLKMDDVVTGMRFGRFGREDGTLVMSTKRGGLYVKILKRTAKFEEKDKLAGPPAAQNTKLNLPKKTKLFVDQTQREREQCVESKESLVLAHSLCIVETTRKLVVSVGASDSVRGQLGSVFDQIVPVNLLDSSDTCNHALLGRPDLSVTLAQFQCWRLTQFRKCVFMDADTLLLFSHRLHLKNTIKEDASDLQLP